MIFVPNFSKGLEFFCEVCIGWIQIQSGKQLHTKGVLKMSKNAIMNEWEAVLAQVEPDETGMKIDAMSFTGFQPTFFPFVTDTSGSI